MITGGNGATCVKPTDETFECELGDSGSGTVIVSNYNTSSDNNKICPATGIITDDDQLSETTTYTYSGKTSNVTLDITIKKDVGGC